MTRMIKRSAIVSLIIMTTIVIPAFVFAEDMSTDGDGITGVVTNTPPMDAPSTDGDGVTGVVTNTPPAIDPPSTDGDGVTGVVTNTPPTGAPFTDGDGVTGVVTNTPPTGAPSTDGDGVTGVMASSSVVSKTTVPTTTPTTGTGGTATSTIENEASYYRIDISSTGRGSVMCLIGGVSGVCPPKLESGKLVNFKITPDSGNLISDLVYRGSSVMGCIGNTSTCSLMTTASMDTDIAVVFAPVVSSRSSSRSSGGSNFISSVSPSSLSTASVVTTFPTSLATSTSLGLVAQLEQTHSSSTTTSNRGLSNSLIVNKVDIGSGDNIDEKSGVAGKSLNRGQNKPFGNFTKSHWQSIIMSLKPISVTLSRVSSFH